MKDIFLISADTNTKKLPELKERENSGDGVCIRCITLK
jgi:hypothetical protein